MKKMKLNIQLFNGSCSIGTITEAVDDDLNQSTFTIPATCTTTGATYNNSNASMTLQWKYASGSTWTTISKQTFTISKNSSKSKSWTLTLTHQDNGKLENLNFRVQWYITDSTNGTTGVKTVEPATIPRASEITSVSSGTTVYNPTIVWTPLSSSFKYKVKYTGVLDSQSSISGLISPNTTSSYSYNGLSVYHYAFSNANSSTITATATLYTYKSDGTTLIGQKTKTFSITLNSDVKPTISFSNLAEADTTMQNANWGIYVQNHSKLSFKVTTGYVSPTADSVATTITTNGQTFTQNGYTNNTFTTTNVLSSSGTNTISATARDNRGRSTTASTTYNVVAYSNPTIATAQVQRCNANGVVDSNGEYVLINYSGSISACSNKNTPHAVYKVGYRVHNSGSYTYIPLTTNANSYSASGMLYTDGIYAANRGSGTKLQLSTSNTYDIQFYVQDYFTNSTNVQTLDTGFDLMNFNQNGKAMAIGKVSEAGANEELLEIGINTRVDGAFNVNGDINNTGKLKGYTWDTGTNNTTDSWVPVFNQDKIEHRVIPSTYNSTSPVLNNVVVNSIRTKNMFDKNNVIGGYTFYSDGSLIAASDFYMSNLIPVKPSTTYQINNDSRQATYRIGEYNSSQGWIQRLMDVKSFTTSSNTYYIRISGLNSYLATTQLELGSTATTYMSYQNLSSTDGTAQWLSNDILTINKGSLVNNRSYYTNNTIQFNIKLSGVSINANSGTTIITLPTNFAGTVETSLCAIANNYAPIICWFRTDGTIAISSNVALSSVEIRITGGLYRS